MAKRKAAAVSMDPQLEIMAKQRAMNLGFSTFSAYVNQLIRSDLIARGAMVVAEQSGQGNTQQIFSDAQGAPASGPVKYPKGKRGKTKPEK